MVKGFGIVEYNEPIDALKQHRDTFHERGKYLGWEKMDEFYSMNLGNCTDWTGFPMSGKTQVLMECLLNTSLYYGWKHLVYFPDVGDKIEIIADLIHKKTGKTFDPEKPNAITDNEINRAWAWVHHHFSILTKRDLKAKMTPFQFWDMAVEIKEKSGLETASIDSWKDMSHPYSEYGGYAQYLEVVLPYRNAIAENHNLHLHTIIHPKNTEKENGKRKAPTPFDLKGGSEWFNSGKCMITVHRDDLTSNRAFIAFNKIKPRSVGKIGVVDMFFDLNKFVYYEEVQQGSSLVKIYASDKNGNSVIESEEMVKVKMNGFLHSNFDSRQLDLLQDNHNDSNVSPDNPYQNDFDFNNGPEEEWPF